MKISFDIDEMIREHRKLVKILESGSAEDRKEEAKDQKRELMDYLKRRYGKKGSK